MNGTRWKQKFSKAPILGSFTVDRLDQLDGHLVKSRLELVDVPYPLVNVYILRTGKSPSLIGKFKSTI